LNNHSVAQRAAEEFGDLIEDSEAILPGNAVTFTLL
jgi:hypothetical protein